MSRKKIAVAFVEHDLGCLPVLIDKEIAVVRRHLRAGDMDAATAENARVYLAQLEGCAKAIENGRRRALADVAKAARRKAAGRRPRPVKLRLDVPGMAERMMAELRAGRRVHIDCGTIRGRAKPAKEDAP